MPDNSTALQITTQTSFNIGYSSSSTTLNNTQISNENLTIVLTTVLQSTTTLQETSTLSINNTTTNQTASFQQTSSSSDFNSTTMFL